jgi:hypothetical protein
LTGAGTREQIDGVRTSANLFGVLNTVAGSKSDWIDPATGSMMLINVRFVSDAYFETLWFHRRRVDGADFASRGGADCSIVLGLVCGLGVALGLGGSGLLACVVRASQAARMDPAAVCGTSDKPPLSTKLWRKWPLASMTFLRHPKKGGLCRDRLLFSTEELDIFNRRAKSFLSG